VHLAITGSLSLSSLNMHQAACYFAEVCQVASGNAGRNADDETGARVT